MTLPGFDAAAVSPDVASTLRKPAPDDNATSNAPAAVDPDLARVSAAWPTLPPHIRAAVLALVGTAEAGQPGKV